MIWNDWDDFLLFGLNWDFWDLCGILGIRGWLFGVLRWGRWWRGGLLAPPFPSPSPRPSPAQRERGFVVGLRFWVGGRGVEGRGGFCLGSLSFCEGALRFLRGAWAVHERPLRVAVSMRGAVVGGESFCPLLPGPSPRPSPAQRERGFVGGRCRL